MSLLTAVVIVAGLAIIAWCATSIAETVSRSRVRREVMAYVAERAISPEDAARLIEISERADIRRQIMEKAAENEDWDTWQAAVDDALPSAARATRKPSPVERDESMAAG